MKKYTVEFIGTFFLVLTIVLTANGTYIQLAPLAIGLMLTALIYAGGHVSGAHYNPAITLAFWLRGKCLAKDIPGYVIAQIVGGLLAAFIGKYLLEFVPGTNGIISGSNYEFIPAALSEFLGTFILTFVILNVAVAKGTAGNSFYGIAIGLTVTGGVYALGGVSGGVFNPSVAVSVSAIGMTPWSNMFLFLSGQIIAAMVATTIFSYINGPDKE